jgi:hypothetical protein
MELLLSSWTVPTVATLIDIFVRLQKPDIVMLATGLHGRMDGISALSKAESKAMSQVVKKWRENEFIYPKLIFRGTTPSVEYDHMALHDQFDNQAVEMAKLGIWEYWNISSEVLQKLYWAYHRLELPSIYFSDDDNVTSRGFAIDNVHFAPWVYSEINQAFIIKYILHHSV